MDKAKIAIEKIHLLEELGSGVEVQGEELVLASSPPLELLSGKKLSKISTSIPSSTRTYLSSISTKCPSVSEENPEKLTNCQEFTTANAVKKSESFSVNYSKTIVTMLKPSMMSYRSSQIYQVLKREQIGWFHNEKIYKLPLATEKAKTGWYSIEYPKHSIVMTKPSTLSYRSQNSYRVLNTRKEDE